MFNEKRGCGIPQLSLALSSFQLTHPTIKMMIIFSAHSPGKVQGLSNIGNDDYFSMKIELLHSIMSHHSTNIELLEHLCFLCVELLLFPFT
jgi:hypothetical protein